MKKTRRNFIRAFSAATTAIAASLAAPSSASADNECTTAECDPFPVFSEKTEMSREEFNELARKSADEIIDSLKRSENVNLSNDDVEKIRANVYANLEDAIAKYRIIEPK